MKIKIALALAFFVALLGFSSTFETTLAIGHAQNGDASNYKSVHNPNHSIVNVVMTAGVQGDENIPVDNVINFDPNIETLYAVVSTENTAPGTIISARWIAADAQGSAPDTFIDSSQISVEGNVNIAFSLRRAAEPWAPGKYRIEVFEDGEPDGTLDFTIGASAQPNSGPRIARVITFQETDSAGNPIEVNGEFPQGAKTLGAAVFVNNEKPMDVTGVWSTVKVPGWPDDKKLFEVTGQASNQNNGILFTLVRRDGEAWLPGTYKLELLVDDKVEKTILFRVASGASPQQPPNTALQFSYQGKLNVTPEWRAPAALALAPNGDLYVAESGAVRRVKQDFSSTRFGEMGITQGDAKLSAVVSGIAADSNSNIWVANPQHSNIQKFSADGKFLLRFPGDDSQTYDKDGEVNQAYGIAVDKQNNVYVADTLNHRIQKFDANGKFLTKWTQLGLNSPIGITADAQDNLYIADTGNQRVVKADPQGKLLLQFGKAGAGDGEFNNPWNIAVDAAGNIYITDIQNQRVQVFDAQGKFLTKFGSAGTGDGQFTKPAGILVAPGGNVYVTDASNQSIQIFAPQSNNSSAPSNNGGPASGQGNSIADLGFRPNQDGFNFENYGGAYPGEQGDIFVEDLIRMFGKDAVCAGFKNDECQVAPGALEWAHALNQGSNNGHCEGMAVLSLMFFERQTSPQQFGAQRTYDLKLDNHALQRELMYYHALQLADPVFDAKNKAMKQTPSQVLDTIIAGIQSGDPTVVAVRHYEPDGTRVGHAVSPYAVEDKGNGLYYVWIYDNNYPGQERYIEVDRNRNTWKYGFAATNPAQDPNPWSGDADDNLFGATRISLRARQAQCPWCQNNAQDGTDSMTKIGLLGGGDLRVTNSQGQRLGWVDGNFVNEIPGAQDFMLDGGLGAPSVPFYFVPTNDVYEMTMDGSGLERTADSELFIFGGGKSLNIDNITLAPGETNTLLLEGNLNAFTFDPEAAEESQITLTLNGAEEDYYFGFDGMQVDAAEMLLFTLDENSGRLRVDSDNSSQADTYDLTIKRVGAKGMQIFENQNIAFGGGETQYIDYEAWDGQDALSIGVDENDDGTVDQELSEENER